MAARNRFALVITALTLTLNHTAIAATAQTTANLPTTQQLLDKAHASALELRAPYLIEAAFTAIRNNAVASAEPILREIDALNLTPAQRARRQLIFAHIALAQNRFEQVISILQDARVAQNLEQLTTAEQADISLVRAQAFFATNNYFASVQERVFAEPFLSPEQTLDNHQEIRRALNNINIDELRRQKNIATNDTLRGWLELAIAAKNNQPDIKNVNTTSTITNPTTTNTPPIPTINSDVQHVALLLPLTGKLAPFGEAVRDGFLAELFAAKAHGDRIPTVRFYDSDNAAIVPLYQQALRDGATFVIGPLEKNLVAQFLNQQLPTPLLALNRADSALTPPANLYQFGLAPEDEAADLAQHIFHEGKRNILIIADAEDANTRELQKFLERWKNLGGTAANTAFFHGQQDLSTVIRSALNIPRSEARGKELENILNRNIEFTPHRRHDIDAVFMLAKPAQARSIKPLLNFYYAGDVAVYSTSRIYNGFSGATTDRDLDNVRFTEVPWIIQNSPLKQQIIAAQPAAKNYLRLYALGIDSFKLIYNLAQLQASGGTTISGQTGVLSVDAQHIVQRNLLLAEMRAGTAELRTDN